MASVYQRLSSSGVNPSTWRFSGQLGTGRRRIMIIFIAIFFVLTLLFAHPRTRSLGRDLYDLRLGHATTEISNVLSQGPPTYERLKKWEQDLPQHNLDLPLPEGKGGRYVKFTNQIKMLGWNNVFNEVYVLL